MHTVISITDVSHLPVDCVDHASTRLASVAHAHVSIENVWVLCCVVLNNLPNQYNRRERALRAVK